MVVCFELRTFILCAAALNVRGGHEKPELLLTNGYWFLAAVAKHKRPTFKAVKNCPPLLEFTIRMCLHADPARRPTLGTLLTLIKLMSSHMSSEPCALSDTMLDVFAMKPPANSKAEEYMRSISVEQYRELVDAQENGAKPFVTTGTENNAGRDKEVDVPTFQSCQSEPESSDASKLSPQKECVSTDTSNSEMLRSPKSWRWGWKSKPRSSSPSSLLVRSTSLHAEQKLLNR